MKFFKKNNKKEKTHKVELGNLYDINKSLIENNVVALSDEVMQEKKNMIITFLEDTDNHYYMLLCNDRKDYTVFHKDGGVECLQDILIDECLPNRGKTKSFELTENKDAIEIWLSIDGESYCYYFFPYDSAIIEC